MSRPIPDLEDRQHDARYWLNQYERALCKNDVEAQEAYWTQYAQALRAQFPQPGPAH